MCICNHLMCVLLVTFMLLFDPKALQQNEPKEKPQKHKVSEVCKYFTTRHLHSASLHVGRDS